MYVLEQKTVQRSGQDMVKVLNRKRNVQQIGDPSSGLLPTACGGTFETPNLSTAMRVRLVELPDVSKMQTQYSPLDGLGKGGVLLGIC